MDRNLVALAFCYTCVFISVYIIYDVFERTLHDILGISPKDFGGLDMLYGLKLPGVAIFTSLADITRRHRTLAAVSILLYVAFNWLYCAAALSGAYIKVLTRINSACLFFSMASVFPLMDTITLDYLERTGNVDRGYAQMKIFEIVGQLLATGLYIGTYRRLPGYFEKKEPLIVSAIAGVLAAISLIFVPPTHSAGKARGSKFSLKVYLAEVAKIACSGYALVLLTVFMEGIARRGSSSYASAYMEANNFERKQIKCMHAIRSVFAILNYLFIKQWRRRLSYFSMLNIGTSFGLLRSLLFLVIGLCKPNDLLCWFIFAGTEIAKGFLSVFFLFAVASISNKFATSDNRALLQGMYNGTYNGLGSVASGMIAYLVFENKDAKEQNRSFVMFFGMMTCCTLIAVMFSLVLSFVNRRKIKG